MEKETDLCLIDEANGYIIYTVKDNHYRIQRLNKFAVSMDKYILEFIDNIVEICNYFSDYEEDLYSCLTLYNQKDDSIDFSIHRENINAKEEIRAYQYAMNKIKS